MLRKSKRIRVFLIKDPFKNSEEIERLKKENDVLLFSLKISDTFKSELICCDHGRIKKRIQEIEGGRQIREDRFVFPKSREEMLKNISEIMPRTSLHIEKEKKPGSVKD